MADLDSEVLAARVVTSPGEEEWISRSGSRADEVVRPDSVADLSVERKLRLGKERPGVQLDTFSET